MDEEALFGTVADRVAKRLKISNISIRWIGGQITGRLISACSNECRARRQKYRAQGKVYH